MGYVLCLVDFVETKPNYESMLQAFAKAYFTAHCCSEKQGNSDLTFSVALYCPPCAQQGKSTPTAKTRAAERARSF
jgi:hypothetical protein